jgi:tetratricopeptide (TPR) repeat protein
LFGHQLGIHWTELGDYDKALGHYGQDIELRRQLNDRPGEAKSLQQAAFIHAMMGTAWAPLFYVDHALKVIKAIEDQYTLPDVQMTAAAIYQSKRDTTNAMVHYERALYLYRTQGDLAGEGSALQGIGEILEHSGELQKARQTYEEALSIRRAVGYKAGVATTLKSLGIVWHLLKDFDKAHASFEEALSIRRSIGDRQGEGIVLRDIGNAWFVSGHPAKTIACFEEAYPIFLAVGDLPNLTTLLNAFGKLYRMRNIPGRTDKMIRECIEVSQRRKNPAYEAEFRTYVAVKQHDAGFIHDDVQELRAVIALMEAHQVLRLPNGTSLSDLVSTLQSWRQGRPKREPMKMGCAGVLFDMLEQWFR